MKRTFYEMLGVPHDADKSQIDMAYALTTAKLNAADLRGNAETVLETQLIRDGYQILSDPARRARYDAKLAAAESGVQLMFFPEGGADRRKLGVQTMVFAALVTAFGWIVYTQMTSKMDEVRIEHAQAVTKEKEKRDKAIQADTLQMDAPGAKASIPEQKR